MNKHIAYEMQKHTKPLQKRLFYALPRVAMALVAVLLVVFAIAVGAEVVAKRDAQAAQQDTEALSSREWAGQQVCGPDMTAVWATPQIVECYRNTRLAHGAGQ